MKKLKIFGARQSISSPELVEKLLRELIAKPPQYPAQLEHHKRRFCKQNDCAPFQNRELVVLAKELHIELPKSLEQFLQKRAVRTISGVSPIGILTKPYPCPGRCVYCPTEDRMPKSYMKNQPAAARALRNNFHPYKQVHNRIIALEESGHPVSKLEVIVMGGTWSFLPHKYQSWYVKKIFDAANGSPEVVRQISEKRDQRVEGRSESLEVRVESQSNTANRSLSQREKERGISDQNNSSPTFPLRGLAKTLKQAQTINETAEKRVIGLTLETRPDFITERELVRMRRYGCTRIEIGVQTLDDDIQKLTKRGHDRRHVFRAMRLMKDFGFKVCWHLMPGLPGSTPEKDLAVMKEVFENEDCRPDFIKIYPCVVLETAELKEWWQDGRYEPYRDEEIVKLLVQFQTIVPPWVRIMRLMRDIPVSNILDGAKFSNLRQILTQQPAKLREIVGDEFFFAQGLDKTGVRFMDIRSREVGFQDLVKHPEILDMKPVLKRRDYRANGGDEVFLSFESADETTIFALLRLRKPSGQTFEHFGSVLHNAALIREVHSYGSEISVGEEAGLGQHRGLGKKLIAEAEAIARDEWGLNRMTIIAGVGTREYYRKWGYELRSTYMTKRLG